MVFNLIGKLGKAVGLEGEFGKGFVTGAAGRISQTIDDDISQTKENASRLAQIRFERGVKEKDRYDEDSRENELRIKGLVASLEGNSDAVRYILEKNEYNLDSAKQEIDKLLVNKEYGMTVPDIVNNVIGLEQSTNRAVSSEELTNLVTKPISIPDITKFDDVASGVMRLPFFGGSEKAAERAMDKSTAELKAYGAYPSMDEVEKNTPPALKGKINPIFSNRSANPVEEIGRLTNLAITFKSKGQDDLAYEALFERDILAFNQRSAQNSLSGQPAMNRNDEAAAENIYKGIGASNYATHAWNQITGQYDGNKESADATRKVDNVINQRFLPLLSIVYENVPSQIGAVTRGLKTALTNNLDYEIIAMDRDGNIIDTSKQSLTSFPGDIMNIDVVIKDTPLFPDDDFFITNINKGAGSSSASSSSTTTQTNTQTQTQTQTSSNIPAAAQPHVTNIATYMGGNNKDIRKARAELSALRRQGFTKLADQLKAQYNL